MSLTSDESNPSQEPKIRDLSLSRDGHLMAMAFGDSAGLFSRNRTTGALALLEDVEDGEGGIGTIGGSSHAVLSQDGAHVYIIGRQDRALTAFAVATAFLTARIRVSGGTGLGDAVFFHVTLANAGNAPLRDGDTDEFVDTLPSPLLLLDARLDQGAGVVSVDAPANRVTWNGSLGIGEEAFVTIEARIGEAFPGQLIESQAVLQFDANGDGVNESTSTSDDPDAPGNEDANVLLVQEIQGIPTLSLWGAISLFAVLASGLQGGSSSPCDRLPSAGRRCRSAAHTESRASPSAPPKQVPSIHSRLLLESPQLGNQP